MVSNKTERRQLVAWRTLREGAWGLLAGAVGSLCCIGPSAAILFGLGSSSALFGLQINRPLALLGSIVILLVGVVFAIRRARTCGLRPHARWRTIAIMLATSALTYGLLGIVAPIVAAQREEAGAATMLSASSPAPAGAPALRQARLLVEKMYCPPCAAHLHGLFARKPFIKQVVAQATDEQVILVYDSRETDVNQLIALIPRNYGVSLRDDVPLP